jgi:hypothetical protein
MGSQGPKGDTGETGPAGPPGADGTGGESSVENPVAGSAEGIIVWVGTQSQYDAISSKNVKTIYHII